MSYCYNYKITVQTPVNLSNETIALYDIVNEFGYNIFDSEDPFYNDICTSFTSKNGTDMILSDRQNDIFSLRGNISICQYGCEFESYNKNTKRAKCNCDIQKEATQTDLSKLTLSRNIFTNSFLVAMHDSNILVLKCYKVALDFSNLFLNIGRIIMTIILFLYLVLLLIFFIKDRKTIDFYISTILKDKKYFMNNEKMNESKNHKENKTIIYKEEESKRKKGNKKKKKKRRNKEKINEPIKRKKNKSHTEIKEKKIKKHLIDNSEGNLLSKKDNMININIIPISNINYKKIKKNKFNNNIKSKKQRSNLIKSSKTVIHKKKINFKDAKIKIKNKRSVNSKIIYKNMNDYELNHLGYKLALIYDKRTYIQYYCSLLKKKNLIFFTFMPGNDYNLITLKISLFLLSFSLYFTINCFFFTDNTMHKFYVDYNDFIHQIPPILFSSFITFIINIIFRLLSLSENELLSIKKEIKISRATIKANNIKKCLIIKFIIFFISSTILLLFFWYFISCFCGVYVNTQIILIQDSLISFGISMCYPFAIDLFPGIFRIYALRAKNKNKKCLYQFGCFISLI